MTSKNNRLAGLAKEFDALLAASSSTLVVHEFTSTPGQTVFTGADNNGVVLNYLPGSVLVALNGFMLQKTSDYAATSGTSITLTSSSSGDELLQVFAFGTFTVANHYTKAEDDALLAQRYTQAQVDALLVDNRDLVPQGYIEGLQLVWVSATSLDIKAGSAYVQSAGKRVAYAGGNIVPSGAANAFIHLYLTSAGAIEQSSTAPVRYYNQAHSKTGDNTRRYIGSVLVSATANQVYKFHHQPGNSMMMYTHGNPSAIPFRLLNAISGTGTFTTAPCCPPTSYSLIGSFQSIGASGIVQFTPGDAATAVATGWEVFVSQAIVANGTCRIAEDRSIAYYTSGSNSASCYCSGYYFDR